jgi:hypothetical protein
MLRAPLLGRETPIHCFGSAPVLCAKNFGDCLSKALDKWRVALKTKQFQAPDLDWQFLASFSPKAWFWMQTLSVEILREYVDKANWLVVQLRHTY